MKTLYSYQQDLGVLPCKPILNNNNNSKKSTHKPKKLRGTESWKSNVFARTKSPTVRSPEDILVAARYITPIKPAEKMVFCVKFKKASEELVFKEAKTVLYYDVTNHLDISLENNHICLLQTAHY